MEWFTNFIEKLKGSKAYILLASAILAAVAAYLGDEITLFEMVSTIWAALTGMAFRAGISKSKNS